MRGVAVLREGATAETGTTTSSKVAPPAMPDTEERDQPLRGGRLNAAIANHVVRLFSEYTGRGPTQARTIRSGNVVAVFTEDLMTKAERVLAHAGEEEAVVSLRRKFQSTMRDDLVAGVETLTDRKVVSLLSEHDALRDCCVEVFILEAPVEDEDELRSD